MKLLLRAFRFLLGIIGGIGLGYVIYGMAGIFGGMPDLPMIRTGLIGLFLAGAGATLTLIADRLDLMARAMVGGALDD